MMRLLIGDPTQMAKRMGEKKRSYKSKKNGLFVRRTRAFLLSGIILVWGRYEKAEKQKSLKTEKHAIRVTGLYWPCEDIPGKSPKKSRRQCVS